MNGPSQIGSVGRLGKAYGVARLAARLGRFAVAGRRRPVSLDARLHALPRRGLPLRHPVRIAWNEHQVPFITADDDRDLAVGLGMVHAHLRLAQMEIMRRIAYGRLSEVLGGVALELDHALRIVDFPRAVPAIIAQMPMETRDWVDAFTQGINAVQSRAPARPEEFRLFGVKPEAWQPHHVVAVGRLASLDFSWRVWHRLLSLQDRPDWTHLWSRIVDSDQAPVPSLAGTDAARSAIGMLFDGLGRPGSNAAAVSARRSATGGALLTSDPHLSVMLPNNWIAAGLSSPGYNVVGLMIPGLPVITLGRNRHVAWSGTSLHAASSDLFDVSDHGPDRIRERRELIGVRWGRTRSATIRETDYGPIITDSALVRARTRRRLALTWIGHRPSDEITAMLGMMRARTWREFTAASEGYAAPALNFVFADDKGKVGQSMAAHLPRRINWAPADLVASREALDDWHEILTARDLPSTYDPDEGFVASANDRPRQATAVPVGFFFSPEERIDRLRTVLGCNGSVSVADLKALHRDVRMPSASAVRDLLLEAVSKASVDAGAQETRLVAALRDWDGAHEAESEGALAFELLLCHLLHALHGDDAVALHRASAQPWVRLHEDMERMPSALVANAATQALMRAAETFVSHRCWGDIHRLRLSHPLASLPGLGHRFRFGDVAVGGSNETLMKTAHGLSDGPHAVGFGANARFLADMSDPDGNCLVLLGGQDGWLGSTTFIDQLDLWQRGDYVPMPLTAAGVRRSFRHETMLHPDPERTGA